MSEPTDRVRLCYVQRPPGRECFLLNAGPRCPGGGDGVGSVPAVEAEATGIWLDSLPGQMLVSSSALRILMGPGSTMEEKDRARPRCPTTMGSLGSIRHPALRTAPDFEVDTELGISFPGVAARIRRRLVRWKPRAPGSRRNTRRPLKTNTPHGLPRRLRARGAPFAAALPDRCSLPRTGSSLPPPPAWRHRRICQPQRTGRWLPRMARDGRKGSTAAKVG